jgi:serine/threonine protein kinase/tetratricopeptide (TPR) repeat protein
VKSCPQCGEELLPGDHAGLCPKCLIQGAFDTSDCDITAHAEEPDTQTIATGGTDSGDDDFGRYRILRPLGEGGMGTVYLAEQREPIRRRVAIKVVKLGMDTAHVLARFDNERQALAVMDHPNIAQIFDAGATAKGRPYFVMEYIDGVPITQYCDRKRLTTTERLTLFLAVCRGVQHAHAKAVIHRDLKPSNVLVTEQDGAPVPKVIDFGIAKATDKWAIENTLLTQFGQIVGTPEYASPEQADTMTGEIDETSDVYSMGVLLYELLIGAVPFDTATLRNAGLAEMLRMIREDEAPSLARKLTSMGAAATGIAERRQTDPLSLRRLVNGDLNSITMKSLEKTRERRYASVADFAADIQRYLEHRPVMASPPSRVYRSRKFFQRHRLPALAVAVTLGFTALSGVTIWSLARRGSPTRPALAEKRAVVLADFVNATGDPGFDGAPRQILAAGLGNSQALSLLSDTRVTRTLGFMRRPADTKLTPDVAAEVCERTASAAVVEGSIASLGSEYVLDLRVRNCQTGDILDKEHEQAVKKADVVRTLAQMANRFSARAGETVPKPKQEPSLRAEVTTPSLEAWRSYSAAMKATQKKSLGAETRSLLRRAIEIDPNFAMAYTQLGLSDIDRAAHYVGKAYELKDQVSDWENYYIQFNYYRQGTGNLELARQTLEAWAQKYPNAVEPHGLLSAFSSQALGRYENAAEEGQKSLQLDPDFAIGYLNTAWAYVYQNRLAEAEALLRRASERKIDFAELSICRYFLAFLRDDKAAMGRKSTYRAAKFEGQGRFEYQEAVTLACQGRFKEASQRWDRALILSRQGEFVDRAAIFQGARAVWHAMFGVRAEAQKNAASALSIHRSRDADFGPAFALALLKDSGQAHRIAEEMAKRDPDYTSAQFSYLPAVRGIEALNRGDAARALEITEVAAPYELAVPGTAFYAAAFFGGLYPVYVRGLAYSRMGRYREAAAEFQKIVDHPGITMNDPVGPMARLQLARALSAAGDRAKSAGVYKDLLLLWKDADNDIPVVQEARAESAKL